MITIPLAGCVVLNETGEMLLIHRNTPALTQWELPGGKLEPGESFGAAAVRELKEEAKVEVEIIRELGNAAFEDRGYLWNYHWFLATIKRGKPEIGEPKTFDGIRFGDPRLINPDELSINVKNLLAAMESGAVTL